MPLNKIISGVFPVRGKFPETEKPSITSVYRLEGKYKQPANQTEVRDALDRTVQVISPGWNRIALPQGSPVRLYVANDFSGSGSDRLYAIFKHGRGTYALYSSATGVDAWRLEPGDVPQHMATSPGAYCKNKLWLIGGSSVDPDSLLNEVWCYEADQSWKRKGRFSFYNAGAHGPRLCGLRGHLYGSSEVTTVSIPVVMFGRGRRRSDTQLAWSSLARALRMGRPTQSRRRHVDAAR
jgi:hypothetical protein